MSVTPFDTMDRRLATLEDGQAQILNMLTKLLEGQSVLHQNDMELKRRLDAKA